MPEQCCLFWKTEAGGEWAHGARGRGRNLATPGRAGQAGLYENGTLQHANCGSEVGPGGLSPSLSATCSSHLAPGTCSTLPLACGRPTPPPAMGLVALSHSASFVNSQTRRGPVTGPARAVHGELAVTGTQGGLWTGLTAPHPSPACSCRLC